MDSERVHTKEEFLQFIAIALDEVRHGAEGWVNPTLESFLEALMACAEDRQNPPSNNPWKHAAMLIQAGAFYE